MITMRISRNKHVKRGVDIWHTMQEGYNLTSWFFVVLAGGVLLQEAFGLKGLAGAGIACAMFYGIGSYLFILPEFSRIDRKV